MATVVDMGPGAVNLRAVRGDDFATRFTLRYAGDIPVTLEGTWRAQIKLAASDAVELDAFTVDATQQDAGAITVHLTAAQTTALPQRTVWDLQNIAAAGVRTWFSGGLYIGSDVTR